MTSVALQPAVDWDREMRGAAMLLKSGLCPVALKTPESVLFVVLAGRDLGLSPVAALRGLAIIQGKIEVSADLQLGLFHRQGGKSSWSELSDAVASLTLTAPWLTKPHTSRFTMEDAKRAGIATGNYQKYPKAMLRSRAITQGLKDIGFDATAGCYAPGEISGVVPIDPDVAAVVTEAEPVALPSTPTQWLTAKDVVQLKREAIAAGIDTPEAWQNLVVDTVPGWTPARGFTAGEAQQIRDRMKADAEATEAEVVAE